MADYTYFNGNGRANTCNYPNGRSLDFALDNTQGIPDELYIQQQITQSYLTSPITHHKHHDSMLELPLSATASPHQHQAEPQPCFPMAQMAPHGYRQSPVNMSRTESDRSNASFGHRQRGHQYRTSFSNIPPGSVGMSRSSTHYSNTSHGEQQCVADQSAMSQGQSDMAGTYPFNPVTACSPNLDLDYPSTRNEMGAAHGYEQIDDSDATNGLSLSRSRQCFSVSNKRKAFHEPPPPSE
jgi:hypothetical protein